MDYSINYLNTPSIVSGSSYHQVNRLSTIFHARLKASDKEGDKKSISENGGINI